MADIKTQELAIFVFILPLSGCHSLKWAKTKFFFKYFLLLRYYFIFFNME